MLCLNPGGEVEAPAGTCHAWVIAVRQVGAWCVMRCGAVCGHDALLIGGEAWEEAVWSPEGDCGT